MQRKQKTLFILLFLVVISLLAVCIIIYNKDSGKTKLNNNNNTGNNKEKPVVVEKKVEIINLESKTRPYAVMINNNHDAWPHAGLNDAYLVYEIIVEGGITRLMALYKDQETAKIGSVRSSRHYFLDYALENDAIYVHYGWSPQAQTDISKLKVDNINGGSPFWRDTTLKVASEHTAFTKITELEKYAESKNYLRDTKVRSLLDYSIEEIDNSNDENAVIANFIRVEYSSYHDTSYKYDEKNQVYNRYMRKNNEDVAHVDAITKEQYTVKNIIVQKVRNKTIDSSGRQELYNIGTGDGYYITNGYAVPITWEKSSRTEKTVYKYLNGKEIILNDGNTYIQIQPIDKKVTIN